MLERYHVSNLPGSGAFRLEGDEAHHLAHVRRDRAGDLVVVFDGMGRSGRAIVRSIGRRAVVLELIGEVSITDGPRPRLTLGTAVPKGDRFDWLVEKATEIGVDRLVPLRTARSVVDPRAAKLDRLRRVVIEACKQSGRDHLMYLEGPMEWSRFLEERTGEAETMRYLADPASPLVALEGGSGSVEDLRLAVGPEGGFDFEERALALELGWRGLCLGPHLLRVETAGLVGSALLLNNWRRTKRGTS